MLCPKCNNANPEGGLECRHCGIIFAKWQALQSGEPYKPPPAPEPDATIIIDEKRSRSPSLKAVGIVLMVIGAVMFYDPFMPRTFQPVPLSLLMKGDAKPGYVRVTDGAVGVHDAQPIYKIVTASGTAAFTLSPALGQYNEVRTLSNGKVPKGDVKELVQWVPLQESGGCAYLTSGTLKTDLRLHVQGKLSYVPVTPDLRTAMRSIEGPSGEKVALCEEVALIQSYFSSLPFFGVVLFMLGFVLTVLMTVSRWAMD